MLYWLWLSPSALCRTLLSWLDGRGLWLNSLLLDVSPPSVWSVFGSGVCACQVNNPSDCQRSLLKMSHTDGSETSTRRKFTYRPRLLNFGQQCWNDIVCIPDYSSIKSMVFKTWSFNAASARFLQCFYVDIIPSNSSRQHQFFFDIRVYFNIVFLSVPKSSSDTISKF
jgi:hypothetical protein